jgi:hypothetical protein
MLEIIALLNNPRKKLSLRSAPRSVMMFTTGSRKLAPVVIEHNLIRDVTSRWGFNLCFTFERANYSPIERKEREDQNEDNQKPKEDLADTFDNWILIHYSTSTPSART